MNELNKSWGEPWITPFTPKVLGNLRSMINQYADGTSTILVPKSRSFSQSINSQVAMLPPTETPITPTPTETVCPTESPPTPSHSPCPTETIPTVSPTPCPTETCPTPTETMHTHTPQPTDTPPTQTET